MTAQVAVAAPLYSADTLLGATTLANSGKAEKQALRDYVGNQLLDPVKPEGKVVASYDNGFWSIDVGLSAPAYCVLKFGNGGTGQPSHFFFYNDGLDSSKLVWTDKQVNFLTNGAGCGTTGSCDFGRLSHFSYIGALAVPPVVIPPVVIPPVVIPPVTIPPIFMPPIDTPANVPPADVPPTEVPSTEVPEPGSLALAGLGLLALLGARKKLAK